MTKNNPRTSSHVMLARKIFPSLMKVKQKLILGKIYSKSVNDGIRTAFYLLKKESISPWYLLAYLIMGANGNVSGFI